MNKIEFEKLRETLEEVNCPIFMRELLGLTMYGAEESSDLSYETYMKLESWGKITQRVKVVKSVHATRTHIPQIGTIGEKVGTKGKFNVIRFEKPFITSEGYECPVDEYNPDRNYPEVFFLDDELEFLE